MQYFHHKNTTGRKGWSHHWYKREGKYVKPLNAFIILFFQRDDKNTVWALYEPCDYGSLLLIRLGYFMMVLQTPFPHFTRKLATTLRYDRVMRKCRAKRMAKDPH